MLEVDAWTGFTAPMTNMDTGGGTRAHDLAVSVCAVLAVQACNVPYGAVARRDVPALTDARLDLRSRQNRRGPPPQARILDASSFGPSTLCTAMDGLKGERSAGQRHGIPTRKGRASCATGTASNGQSTVHPVPPGPWYLLSPPAASCPGSASSWWPQSAFSSWSC